MIAEILAIGTEILLGDIVNTNATHIARGLAAMGINTYFQQVVGDNPERLMEALEVAYSRADLVITSGGLGPTQDDLSKETGAAFLGLSLVENTEARSHIEEYMTRKGRAITPNNWKQALLPEGAIPFQNHNGTAPGFAVEKDGKRLIMLPGPPSELHPMFDKQVMPYLQNLTDGTLVSRTLHICGIGESAVEYELKEWMEGLSNPTLAPYAKEGTVDLRITAKADSEEEAAALIHPVEEKIRAMFGDAVFGADEDTLESVIVDLLKERGWTVATAESCTAGLAAGKLVNHPGASAVFNAGFITYGYDAKVRFLGVSAESLAKYGAVSSVVAAEMAKGAAERAGAETAIAITGIAGPDGGTPEKPVGTVWIGVYCQGNVYTEKQQYHRNRAANRNSAAVTALNLLRLAILKNK